jgi:predicted transcriptional regulator
MERFRSLTQFGLSTGIALFLCFAPLGKPGETAEKEEHQKKVEDKLAELGDRMEELKATAKKVVGRSRDELNQVIEKLQKEKDAAWKNLEDFKAATTETWEKFKSKLDAAIDDLEKSIKGAITQFKKRESLSETIQRER